MVASLLQQQTVTPTQNKCLEKPLFCIVGKQINVFSRIVVDFIFHMFPAFSAQFNCQTNGQPKNCGCLLGEDVKDEDRGLSQLK